MLIGPTIKSVKALAEYIVSKPGFYDPASDIGRLAAEVVKLYKERDAVNSAQMAVVEAAVDFVDGRVKKEVLALAVRNFLNIPDLTTP